METAFTRLVGIEVPIVQAPIGTLTNPRLAAAVSNAGGLGMLALGGAEPDHLRRVVAETQALTDRPFGVNLNLRRPQAERVAAALEAGVRVVSLFWGDPSPHVAAVHAAGAIVTSTAGSAEEARRHADAGVDVIVAQGWEAGGHVWGSVATLPLVPAVVDAVAPVPVVAAGGIADGRGLAAVLALGAAGAWLGTRFVMSEEAGALPAYLARLRDGRETDTVYSQLFDGGWPDSPHRTLRNELTDAWQAAGRPGPGAGPARARWSGGPPRAIRSTATSRSALARASRATSTICRCGPAERRRAPRRASGRRDRPGIVAEAEQTLARLRARSRPRRPVGKPCSTVTFPGRLRLKLVFQVDAIWFSGPGRRRVSS